MGNWYVHRSIPTPLDSNVFNGLEEYTWNEEAQRVQVKYTYNAGSLDGPAGVVYQRGWVKDKKLGTTWGVSPKIGPFHLPFTLPYYILDIDTKDYSYIVCAGTPGPWVRRAPPPVASGRVPRDLGRIRPHAVAAAERQAYVLTRSTKPPADADLKKWLAVLEGAGLPMSKLETVEHRQ